MLRTVFKHQLLSDITRRWVHSSVKGNDAVRGHATFIAAHLAGGLVAIVFFPMWLAVNQGVSLLEAAVFVWLIAPMMLAALVSTTGRLDLGVGVSLAITSIFIAWACIMTGGANSAIALWFCILPMEAAIFSGRKPALTGMFAAIAGLTAVLLVSYMLPEMIVKPPAGLSNTITWFTLVLGLVYGGILAFRLEQRTSLDEWDTDDGRQPGEVKEDDLPDPVSRHSINGDTIHASSAMASLLGCTATELQGKGLLERVHLHDRVVYLSAFGDAQDSDEEIKAVFRVHILKGEDKSLVKWLEMRCRRYRDTETGSFRINADMVDITAIKNAEDLLKRQQEDAEKSNEAKNRFLASISHELRTPLNAIIGFSDILKQELFGKLAYKKHAEYVDLINQSGHHLLNLVNDILDISKIEAGKYRILPEMFDLTQLVLGTVAMFEPQAMENDVEIRTSLPDDLPALDADQRACKQILINLISNAVKFSDAGGIVEIGACIKKQDMEIFVKDCGIGISEDDLLTIGQPFYQIDNENTRKYEGTGLGLFLVKGLTELHGGSLEIQSSPGEGTCVFVRLPMEEKKSRPVPADEKRTLVHLHQSPKSVATHKSRSKEHALVSAISR